MKASKTALFIALFLLVITTGGASVVNVGVITAIKVPVTIQRGDDEFSAQLGDEIFLSDLIKTGIAGRAKILFEGEVILIVAEETTVTITKNLYDSKRRWRDVIYDLRKGMIRTMLEKYSRDSSFIVNSQNAVAGVKGTDFLVRYSQGRELTRIYVLDGKVEVKSRLETVPGIALLTADQWTEVAGNISPAEPRSLTEKEAGELREMTSISDQVTASSMKNFRTDSDRRARAGKALGKSDLPAAYIPPGNPQVSVAGRDLIIRPSAVSKAPASPGRVPAQPHPERPKIPIVEPGQPGPRPPKPPPL